MQLDAYNDMTRQEQANQYAGIVNATPEYIPGYDPDQDPLYQIGDKPHYSADLHLASMNYWAGKTGREGPPPPSYRVINGTSVLGRFVDVYGCQAHMRAARHNWQAKLWGAIIMAGVALACGVEFGILDVAVFLLAAPLFIAVKLHYNQIYRRYYTVQAQILQSGEPVWVPYERKRLKLIEQSSFYVWP
jgi:hypothetical protein